MTVRVAKAAALPWGKTAVSWASFVISAAIVAQAIPNLLTAAGMPDWNGYGAEDYELYMTATQRWLETGMFYEPYQLIGPYSIGLGDILYPPVALWLFVPFTVLPTFLWWAVPLGVTGWVLWKLRPNPLVWPLIAFVVAWEPVEIHVISGNPVMWSMMAVALGTLYRWPAVFAFLKPSLGIFGLFGIWDRRWWYGLVLFCALSLPFLPMWFDWLTAVLNSHNVGGLLYSWQEAPMLLLPIVAWLGRTHAILLNQSTSMRLSAEPEKPSGASIPIRSTVPAQTLAGVSSLHRSPSNEEEP